MAEAEGVDFFHLSDLEQSETEGGRTRIRSEAASLRERYRLLGRYIRQFRLDGLIAVGWYLDREGAEPALLREAAGGLPIVSLGEEAADFPYVKVNGYRYWKQLTEHLIRDHGRRHVGFIMPLNGEDDRLAGYLDAMAEAGLSAGGLVAGSEELASAGEDFQERTRRGIDLLMTRSAHRLDALMLTTFTEGKIALDILRDKGIRVPDDLALVCYEDDDSLQFTDPPLTTVYFPFIECGMMAARKLIRLVRANPSTGWTKRRRGSSIANRAAAPPAAKTTSGFAAKADKFSMRCPPATRCIKSWATSAEACCPSTPCRTFWTS